MPICVTPSDFKQAYQERAIALPDGQQTQLPLAQTTLLEWTPQLLTVAQN